MKENRCPAILKALTVAIAPIAFAGFVLVLLSTAAQTAAAGAAIAHIQTDPGLPQGVTETQRTSPVYRPSSAPRLPAWARQLGLTAAAADLELVLSGPTVIANGDRMAYTLTVTNRGSVTLNDTLIVDVLPKVDDKYVLTEVDCSDNCGRDYESAVIREPLGGTVLVTTTRQVSWTIASLSPGQSLQRRFSGQVVGLADRTSFGNIAYGYNAAIGASTSNVVNTLVRVYPGADGEASLSTAPTWLSADLGGTMSMDWGDFDGDGDLDLALASTAGTTVYHNNQGRLALFWENDLYALGVRWVDVNGDGQLELVTVGQLVDNPASGTGGTIVSESRNHVYRISSGTFITDHTFVSDYQLVRVEAADFTNNGRIDLIASTNSINSWCPVRLYINYMDRFQDGYYNCIGNRATASVSPADFDGDGDIDLITGEFPNKIRVWINAGYPDDWYPFRNSIPIRGLSFLPYDFAWGDYDQDGDLDLAAAFPLDRKARIYRNEGSSFTVAREFRTTLFRTPLDVEWADYDGDSRLDLAVADMPPKIYLNTDGTFSAQPVELLEAGAVKGQIWSMSSADHDTDRDIDLALGNRDGASTLFTTFSSFLDTTLSPVTSVGASSVAWADADGDTDLDLLYGGSLSVLTQNARLYANTNGSFSAADIFDFSGFGPRKVAWGDIDYDRDLDIALSTVAVVRIYVNFAGSLWTSYDLASSSDQINDLAWGDSETDKDLDLFVARDGPNALYINRDGPVDTTPYWTSTEADNSTSVAWGDYDGDNYLDVAVGNRNTPNRVYRNNRDNTFTLAWSAPSAYDTRSVAWADVDGDGDLDLTVGNYGAANLIYGNTGGTLDSTPVWASTEVSNTTSVAWGDWDSDGDLDLAVGNRGQPDQVYDNEGSLSLRWAWRSSEQQNTSQVAWGDQDGDGDLDLAVSQDGSGSSGVYENSYSYPSHLHGGAGPLPNNPSYLSIDRPGATDNAYHHSSAEILAPLSSPTVTISYRIYDAEDDYIAGTSYWFSLDGGGTWQTATPAATPVTATQAYSMGRQMTFLWDAQGDAAIGNDARFRIEIVHQNPVGPVQRASTGATSPPFRLQATTCNWPERPEISFAPLNPQPEDPVQFSGKIQQGTGSDQVIFTWDFGDGSAPVDGQDVEHTYGTNGTFQVRLTVTSAPCPVVKTLAVVRTIVVGSGVPDVYLPVVLKSASGN